MGTLRALTIDPQGYVYNGVTLGEPVELDDDPSTFEWDDGKFPNGVCEVIDGELIVTVDKIEDI